MEQTYSIEQKIKRKLMRADRQVILCGQVIYPCVIGIGGEALNQAYEAAAEAFLSEGLEIPYEMAKQEMTRVGSSFVRWELLCKITATFVQDAEALPAEICQALSKDFPDMRAERDTSPPAYVAVEVQMFFGKKYRSTIEKCLFEKHFWRLPEGVMVTEKKSTPPQKSVVGEVG